MGGMKRKYSFVFIILCSIGKISKIESTAHRSKTFHCINGNYIFDKWFCDGVNDCVDSSDEFYGCDTKLCGSGNFTCNNKKCLPIAVRCNGIRDCVDGSDEEFCDHEPDLTECNLHQGKYLCKDKLRCLDISYICDGETHCFDGSDETSGCNEYNSTLCNTCYHACFRTPDGPYCFYNSTTDNFNERSKDISACNPYINTCAQKCTNYKDHYQCSCEENFLYDYTFFNSLFCVEKDQDKNMLVYVTSKGIKAIPGYKNKSITIITHSENFNMNVTTIAAANGYIYWGGTLEGNPLIGKISMQGGNKTILFTEVSDIGEVTAMDVDWRTGNIYFIDNVQKRLAACTENGPRCIEVHKIQYKANSLALAPRYGLLFWSTFNEEDEYAIRKSDMNGRSEVLLVSDGLRHVASVSVDETSENIYWLDTIRRRIETIKFNGWGRKLFKADLRVNYLDLTVNANYLYWILMNNGSIHYSSSRRLLQSLALIDEDPVLIIYGYSYSEKTTEMTPPCNWGCDGICLLFSNHINRTGSRCICTNKTATVINGKWCPDNCKSTFSFNLSNNNVDFNELATPSENDHQISFFSKFLSTEFFIFVILIAIFAVAYLQRHRLIISYAVFRHTRFQSTVYSS